MSKWLRIRAEPDVTADVYSSRRAGSASHTIFLLPLKILKNVQVEKICSRALSLVLPGLERCEFLSLKAILMHISFALRTDVSCS